MQGESLIMIDLGLNKTNIHSLGHRLDSRPLAEFSFDWNMCRLLKHKNLSGYHPNDYSIHRTDQVLAEDVHISKIRVP